MSHLILTAFTFMFNFNASSCSSFSQELCALWQTQISRIDSALALAQVTRSIRANEFWASHVTVEDYLSPFIAMLSHRGLSDNAAFCVVVGRNTTLKSVRFIRVFAATQQFVLTEAELGQHVSQFYQGQVVRLSENEEGAVICAVGIYDMSNVLSALARLTRFSSDLPSLRILFIAQEAFTPADLCQLAKLRKAKLIDAAVLLSNCANVSLDQDDLCTAAANSVYVTHREALTLDAMGKELPFLFSPIPYEENKLKELFLPVGDAHLLEKLAQQILQQGIALPGFYLSGLTNGVPPQTLLSFILDVSKTCCIFYPTHASSQMIREHGLCLFALKSPSLISVNLKNSTPIWKRISITALTPHVSVTV